MSATSMKVLAGITGRRREVTALLLVAGGLALGACGGDDGGDETPAAKSCAAAEPSAAQQLEVLAQDYKFDPSEPSVTAGPVEITYTPDGAQPHTMLVEGCTEKFSVTAGGDSDTLVLDLKPGEYTIWCDVSGHRAQGMEGTLTVT
jgi:plastocyanin